MELTTEKTCKNCSQEYNGNYCPDCGQKYIDKRITIRQSLGHLFQTTFNFDKGLWPTGWHMITKPGTVIRSYISGITVLYTHPFRFLFLWLTLQVFFMVSTGLTEEIQADVNKNIYGQELDPRMAPMMHAVNSYMHLILTATMPFFAFGSWIFFKSKGYNYAENLVITTYAYGEVVLISLVIMVVLAAFGAYNTSVTMIMWPLTIGYIAYVFTRVFSGNPFINLLKAIGSVIFWFIGIFVIMIIVIIPIMIYQMSKNPEMLEQMKPPA